MKAVLTVGCANSSHVSNQGKLAGGTPHPAGARCGVITWTFAKSKLWFMTSRSDLNLPFSISSWLMACSTNFWSADALTNEVFMSVDVEIKDTTGIKSKTLCTNFLAQQKDSPPRGVSKTWRGSIASRCSAKFLAAATT